MMFIIVSRGKKTTPVFQLELKLPFLYFKKKILDNFILGSSFSTCPPSAYNESYDLENSRECNFYDKKNYILAVKIFEKRSEKKI